MNYLTLSRCLAPVVLCTTALAQKDFLLSYSQLERTKSGSGGTVLQFLHPNEIAHLTCWGPSAEKWAPRTCFNTMAGDENSDATFWNPAIFGSIDALLGDITSAPAAVPASARTVFWSPSATMGNGVSGSVLHPGDVGRIVRNAAGDGQVEYFMDHIQFNLALGLPSGAPTDVDAIAFAPGRGVFFSIDQDTPAVLACGPTLVQDGALLWVPDSAITYTPDMRVAAVLPNSAHVLYSEAQMDAMVQNAQITDRFGNCLSSVVDLESLEIDWWGPVNTVVLCSGATVQVPSLIFSAETMTGCGLCTTKLGGQIYLGSCGTIATGCGGGPTLGSQMGVQPTSATVGAPSYVNALAWATTYRYVMEPQQHVVVQFPLGLPQGSQMVDISAPTYFGWNFILWTTSPTGVNAVAQSATNPLGLFTFPDFYPSPSFYTATLTVSGFASWPMVAIPPNFTGTVIFQSVALPPSGTWELSNPITVEFR